MKIIKQIYVPREVVEEEKKYADSGLSEDTDYLCYEAEVDFGDEITGHIYIDITDERGPIQIFLCKRGGIIVSGVPAESLTGIHPVHFEGVDYIMEVLPEGDVPGELPIEFPTEAVNISLSDKKYQKISLLMSNITKPQYRNCIITLGFMVVNKDLTVELATRELLGKPIVIAKLLHKSWELCKTISFNGPLGSYTFFYNGTKYILNVETIQEAKEKEL